MKDNPNTTHWNYRVLRRKYPNGYISYAVYEVYYDGNNPHAHSAEPVAPFGETPNGLREDVKLQWAAFQKPYLDYGTMAEI